MSLINTRIRRSTLKVISARNLRRVRHTPNISIRIIRKSAHHRIVTQLNYNVRSHNQPSQNRHLISLNTVPSIRLIIPGLQRSLHRTPLIPTDIAHQARRIHTRIIISTVSFPAIYQRPNRRFKTGRSQATDRRRLFRKSFPSIS